MNREKIQKIKEEIQHIYYAGNEPKEEYKLHSYPGIALALIDAILEEPDEK